MSNDVGIFLFESRDGYIGHKRLENLKVSARYTIEIRFQFKG